MILMRVDFLFGKYRKIYPPSCTEIGMEQTAEMLGASTVFCCHLKGSVLCGWSVLGLIHMGTASKCIEVHLRN